MNFDQKYADLERLLSCEGDSLADLLENLGNRLSPVLIGGQHRDRLFACAQQIPSSAAALPFGFILPLRKNEAGASLAITLANGTKSAAYYERMGKETGATPATSGLSRLLRSTRHADSPFPQVTGKKWFLEYDLFGHTGNRLHPWVVFRTSEQPIFEKQTDRKAIEIVLSAIFNTAGWQADPREIRHFLRLYEAMEASAQILTFAVFPSVDRMIRVAVSGFQSSDEVSKYLDRIDFDERQRTTVNSVISFFETGRILNDLSIRFDLDAHGLGSTLRLGLYSKKRAADDPRHWVDSSQAWDPFLSRLQETLAPDPEKLSALSQWQSPPEVLIGRSGILFLLRGIHHIEVVLRHDCIDDVHANVFCLLCPSLTEMP